MKLLKWICILALIFTALNQQRKIKNMQAVLEREEELHSLAREEARFWLNRERKLSGRITSVLHPTEEYLMVRMSEQVDAETSKQQPSR